MHCRISGFRFTLLGLAGLAGQAVGAPAAAADWSVGAFEGQGVHANLVDIPFKAIGGELRAADTRTDGLLLRRRLDPPAWFVQAGEWGGSVVATQVELGLFHYRGLVHNSAVTLDWRPQFRMVALGDATWNFGLGVGVWHSFGRPWYDHMDHPEYNDRYRTLLHLAPEVSLQHAALPGWHFGVRIHHASGFYGAITPAEVAANYLGVTVVRDL